MDICNCHIDLDKLLCDIPLEWRKGIVNSICLILQNDPITCDDIRECETLTSLSPFTLVGTLLSITYKDENGVLNTRSIDLGPIIEGSLDDIDPYCLATPEEWAEWTHEQRLQSIIDSHCECCTTTTTSTSSTTTTTTEPFDYYLADLYNCEDGNCVLIDENQPVKFPVGFIFTPGYYYADNDINGDIYVVVAADEPNINAVLLDTEGFANCNSQCPQPTTTTTTTSSTSTTSTTSSSTTTTTTEAPLLAWIPLDSVCETEGGFGVLKTITGLSSPQNVWYDTVNELAYVADGDSPNGNVYWFDPVTALTEADMTYSATITYSELYNSYIDTVYRRIYFVGANTNGLLVYDIDTDTVSTVIYGTNGAFSRTLLTVTSNLIYCNNGNTEIVIINRSTLAITGTVTVGLLTNSLHFTSGPYNLHEVGSELWVVSFNSDMPTIGRYAPDFSVHYGEITLPGAATWSFNNYWQAGFLDPVSGDFYVADWGSSRRHIIDTASATVIDTKTYTNREGKTNAVMSWTIDPITNQLYMNYRGMNSSSDGAAIIRIFKEDRDTDTFTTMYEGDSFTNLVHWTGTGNVLGTNTGNVFWVNPADYSDDGTITILANSLGSTNTGTEIIITLQEVDVNNGNLPTGNTKPNVPSDPDYVEPIEDSPNCPVDVLTTCPIDVVTTFTNLTDTLEFEVSLASGVILNPIIDIIEIWAYNIDTASLEGTPATFYQPYASNYFAGTITGLTGTNYTVRVRYITAPSTIITTC